MNTVVNNSFIRNSFNLVSGVFGPGDVRIMVMPIIPKAMEA